MVESIVGVLVSEIMLPLWLALSLSLSGVVVGMLFLTLALMLLKRGRELRRDSYNQGAIEGLAKDIQAQVNERVAVAPRTRHTSARQALPATAVTSMPGPFKQHYWYYISGVKGRFATLREALIASGVKVTAETSPDWKKLPSGTRDRITRYRLEDEQPVPEAQLEKQSAPALEPVVAHKTVARVASEPDSELVVRKSIGNGAFVTIKKKS